MSRASVVVGRGCCSASKKQKRLSNLASFVCVLLEIILLVAMLVLGSEGDVNMEGWLRVIIIIILSLHVLIQMWDLKSVLWPNLGEKFSLTIQGSHARKPSRRRTTMYGVTISEEVRIDFDRNADGMLVYFRKVTSSNTGPYCQPFLLPLKGWFTFFHILIALALVICTIIVFSSYNEYKDYEYLSVEELGTYPALLSILLLITSALQIPVIMAFYYRAEDCGFCLPIFWIGYTRWFKHTNTYTDLIQQNIQSKHGQRLVQEGDQLELAIRRNMQQMSVNGVSVHNVGPQTAKRYEDQIVLLHLLLAQEHDLLCKQVFPEYNIENKGVSFTLTAEEIDTLNKYAQQLLETPKEVVIGDSDVDATVDIADTRADENGS